MDTPSFEPETYFSKKESILLMNVLYDKISEERLKTIGRKLQEPLDWNYFIKSALSHRVIPIVYFNMKRYGLLKTVPDYVQIEMHRGYLESQAANLACFEELQIILEKFEIANLNLLALKGPALAQSIYEDNGLRMFSDIDILVHREDMDTVAQVMEGLGYMILEEARPLDYYDTCHFHHIYSKESDFITYVIEVHWDLFPPSSTVCIDLKSLWEREIIVPLQEMKLHTLNWDDHFLYLCAHSAFGGFNSLLSFCDLVRITHKLKDDSWDEIADKAKLWGIEDAVAGCMQIFKNLFGKTMPYPRVSLRRAQQYFTNSIFSDKKLVQPDWSYGLLAKLLFFKESILEFIRSYLFPREKEIYRYQYTIPKEITLRNRVIFFLKGVKILMHTGWSFVKICLYQLGRLVSVGTHRKL